MEKDFSSFHDRFQAIEANGQEIIDILKMWEKFDEFEIMAYQAPADPLPSDCFCLLSISLCILLDPLSLSFYGYVFVLFMLWILAYDFLDVYIFDHVVSIHCLLL